MLCAYVACLFAAEGVASAGLSNAMANQNMAGTRAPSLMSISVHLQVACVRAGIQCVVCACFSFVLVKVHSRSFHSNITHTSFDPYCQARFYARLNTRRMMLISTRRVCFHVIFVLHVTVKTTTKKAQISELSSIPLFSIQTLVYIAIPFLLCHQLGGYCSVNLIRSSCNALS